MVRTNHRIGMFFMRYEPLETLEKILSYDPSTGLFTKRAIVGRKVRPNDNLYITIGLNGRVYSAHRLAWYLYYKRLPRKGYEIDHINKDKGDNRIENLREVKHYQNMRSDKQPNYQPPQNPGG